MADERAENDDQLDDDEMEVEIHIEFDPYEERLAELNITLDAFEEALARAVDEHAEAIESAASEDELPQIEDLQVQIGNQSYRITELADISVTTGTGEDYEDDDDYDDYDEDDYDEDDEEDFGDESE